MTKKRKIELIKSLLLRTEASICEDLGVSRQMLWFWKTGRRKSDILDSLSDKMLHDAKMLHRVKFFGED